MLCLEMLIWNAFLHSEEKNKLFTIVGNAWKCKHFYKDANIVTSVKDKTEWLLV